MHEKSAYAILDQMTCIKHYATEAYAIKGQVLHAGQQLQLNKHAWDVMLAPPYRVLIEVQGEQHITKLDTRRNSNDSSLADRSSRDSALAAAAQDAGYSVLWLVVGADKGQRRRWKQAITRVMHDADAHMPPKLYIG